MDFLLPLQAEIGKGLVDSSVFPQKTAELIEMHLGIVAEVACL